MVRTDGFRGDLHWDMGHSPDSRAGVARFWAAVIALSSALSALGRSWSSRRSRHHSGERHAQNLVDGGDPVQDLVETVLAERLHPLRPSGLADLADVGVAH